MISFRASADPNRLSGITFPGKLAGIQRSEKNRLLGTTQGKLQWNGLWKSPIGRVSWKKKIGITPANAVLVGGPEP